MEFMFQYDATIHYLPGERNSAGDALSCLSAQTCAIIAAALPQKVTTRFKLEDALIQEI